MQCDDRGYCSKAVKRISKDYRGFGDDMKRAMKLLGDRFCPMTRVEPVRPGKLLHRVTVADTYEVWKFSVAVAGSKLRMAQWPRLWFGVVEGSMVLVPLEALLEPARDGGFPLFSNGFQTSLIHSNSLQITSFLYKTWAKRGHGIRGTCAVAHRLRPRRFPPACR